MLNIELSKRQANEVIDMKFLTELKCALIFYVILSSSFTASSMFYSAIVQVCLAYNEICHKKPQKSSFQWKADNFNLPNKAKQIGLMVTNLYYLENQWKMNWIGYMYLKLKKYFQPLSTNILAAILFDNINYNIKWVAFPNV